MSLCLVKLGARLSFVGGLQKEKNNETGQRKKVYESNKSK
jgi:hypothetical protein